MRKSNHVNEEVRTMLKEKNIKLWQLADMMDVSEATITRLMRHELSEEMVEEIRNLIEGEGK